MTAMIKGPERSETIVVHNGKLSLNVQIAGSGPALVYFHGAGGLYWDHFVDHLATTHTVYAPELPGTSAGDPYAIHQIDSFADLLLLYEEALHKLGIEKAIAVGQSLGGMIAADLAAHFRTLFAKIVLLAPGGLWQEDLPYKVLDLYACPPEEVPGYLFLDPGCPGAQAMLAMPEDLDQMAKHIAANVWALGCSGKFLWPFAEHGLADRLHRIAADTLVIWGKEDALVPVAYADLYAAGVASCQISIIENCGHIPQLEKYDETIKVVSDFLG
jgi:pimeloyl-ACP methyl ester carboxylesterase